MGVGGQDSSRHRRSRLHRLAALCPARGSRAPGHLASTTTSSERERTRCPGVDYREAHTRDIADDGARVAGHRLPPRRVLARRGEPCRARRRLGPERSTGRSTCSSTGAAKRPKLVYAGSSTKFADGGLGRDQSPYAFTKATNSELVRNYGEWYGLPFAITYFYNVFGPGERAGDVRHPDRDLPAEAARRRAAPRHVARGRSSGSSRTSTTSSTACS